MKAEEIRKDGVLGSNTTPALREIAAQLAEINEKLLVLVSPMLSIDGSKIEQVDVSSTAIPKPRAMTEKKPVRLAQYTERYTGKLPLTIPTLPLELNSIVRITVELVD